MRLSKTKSEFPREFYSLMLNVVCISSLFLSGCFGGSNEQPQYEVEHSHNYKVSVYNDGKEVKDFNTPLVQRMTFTPQMMSSFTKAHTGLPVDGVIEKDQRGNVMGIRIVASRRGGNPAVLGLREKDLIISIADKPARQIEDLRRLFSNLERDKNSSIALERDGRPHKILYYLSNS